MFALVRACVSRPVFTWVMSLALIVIGVFSFTTLSVDRFPNIDLPFVTVVTVYPGASPEQVETEVSDVIEEAVNSISGVSELQSTSYEGLSVVGISFELEKDGDVASQEVRDRVNRILAELPDDAEPPRIEKIDPDAAPVLYVAVRGPGTPQELTEFTKKQVKERLEGTQGIGDMRLFGGREREIRVEIDPARLEAQGLAVTDVQLALTRENLEVPGGTLTQGTQSLQVRVPGRVKTAGEFAKLPIAKRNGHVVEIADVATVVDAAAEPTSFAVVDGSPVVMLAITRQSGTNTIAVVDLVRERLAEIEGQLPAGYDLEIVRDESTFVRTSIGAVEEHLVLGAICAVIVVLVFLRNWRSTIIAALAIPVSIIATFAVIAAMGLTLNSITLLALTLAVGIVIDDAIVVLENVMRFLEEREGSDPKAMTLAATKEISLAVLATTLSLVAVFLPIGFMGGIMGRFLSSFGLTMAAAVMVSLFVAFTLTPMLCARWLKRTGDHEHRPHPHGDRSEALSPELERARFRAWRRGQPGIALPDTWLEKGYTRLLGFCMERRWVVGVAIIASLASMFVVGRFVPTAFLPEDDQGRFEVTIELAEGTSLGQTDLVSERIASELRQLADIEHTVVTVGSDEGDISGRGTHQATIYVGLHEASERKRSQAEIQNVVRDAIMPTFAERYGLDFTVSTVSAFGGSGAQAAPVQYVLRGPHFDELEKYSNALADALRDVPGVAQSGTTYRAGRPELRVEIDRDRAAELGVSVQDVAMALRVLVGGADVTSFEIAGEQYDVRLQAAEHHRANETDLDRYRVRARDGQLVALSQVATIATGESPAAIQHIGRGRSVMIYATTLPGASTGEILAALDRTATELDMPATYSTTLTGQSREFGKAATAFLIAIVLSLIFMYLIIAAQFESWIHPITIMVSLPLTIPFAMLSLLIFRQSLNVFSALGILVLFGIVKKNSILQVDHTLTMLREGWSRPDAIMLANRDRLRPILMTTLAFVAGMAPLMLSGGPGSATNRAIAGIVIGGQSLSLLLTLVATPAMFVWLDNLSKVFTRFRAALLRRFSLRAQPT